MEPNDRIYSLRKSIDNQEERVQQHNLHELRQRYEQSSKRETELNGLLSQEKARNRMQQLEIDRRQQQLEKSTEMIRSLQEELEIAWKKSRSVSMELRESEMRSVADEEIVNLKTQLSGLEARLKKKQLELDNVNDSERESKREINQLRSTLEAKMAEINLMKRNFASDEETQRRERNYHDSINQEIGSLKSENASLKLKLDELREENLNLQTKTIQSEEEKKRLQFQIDTLKGQLTNSEGSTGRVYSHLTDEMEKVKQQKASLRYEHVQLKRKFEAMEMENKTLRERIEEQKKSANELEEFRTKFDSIEMEKKSLKTENENLKRQLENLDIDNQKKVNEIETLMRENEESEKAQLKLLNSELEVQRRKYADAKKCLVELDLQCDKLMAKLRTASAELNDAQKEKELLAKQLEEFRDQSMNKFKMQSEFSTLKERNKQMEGKIAYLESELKEARNDHRRELSKLSEQLIAANASTQAKQNDTANDNKEAQIRTLERQLEQMKKEHENISGEMKELRERELEVINENTLLRQKFGECLKKAEDFNEQVKLLKEANIQLKEDTERNKEKYTSMEDQLFEMRNEMEQKEKLIAYLQSVVQPKQMQRLPHPRSSLLSSEAEFFSDIESESKHCQQLEQHRNELKMDLEKKRKALTEKQNIANESVPLLKDKSARRMPQAQQSLATSSLKNSSTESSINNPRVPGKMRHDIPHRWKRQFITVNSNFCQVCMEGFPYFRHVYRCRDCAMVVHSHCRQHVVNTCGLPYECANFYLDTHSLSSEHMTGWVKLLHVPNVGHVSSPCKKWCNAWVIIEDHKLSFYESDQLALSEAAMPFISIDLDREQWRIYNQIAEKPLEGVRGEDMSLLIELRLPNHTILMLVPTIQAKQRWVQALQLATSRRMFIQRRPSSAIVGNTLLLALEAPQNLSINCTKILRNEWLLIGADEGLFATSIQHQILRAPFQIAGIPKVFWMELLPEFDMFVAICGSNRRLTSVHMQQLNRALKLDQQPGVHLTCISNIEQCHNAVLSKPEQHSREKCYIYLATCDSIIILQYVLKLGVFSPIKQLKTEEPCMCICPCAAGFIFGADNFHFVREDDGFSSTKQLMVDNCPFDFPVAAVEISDNEYLLAFHNFGLFVDAQGQRTRSRNIEWERVPLEFVYTAPFLYIVYCEFLEVVRIAPLIGPESGTITDDRNIFKCRSAHKTGSGLNESEVLFAVSNEDRVELHSFSRYDKDQHTIVKSILKRKFNEAATLSTSKKKH